MKPTEVPMYHLESSWNDDNRPVKRVKCIFCKKSILVSKLAGVNKKGFYCNNTICLIKMQDEIK